MYMKKSRFNLYCILTVTLYLYSFILRPVVELCFAIYPFYLVCRLVVFACVCVSARVMTSPVSGGQ